MKLIGPPQDTAALLEAMEERQVTVSGQTCPLDAPFFCVGYPESD